MVDPRQQVLAHVDDEELVELARGLAAFASYSGQEQACAEWLASYLEERGVEVELREAEPNRPNCIARVRGDGSGASLMFNGHLDIDPIPQGYKHDPWDFAIRDGRLYGHGLANMKAGVASMVHAAVAVKRAGIPLKGDLVVAGVVGELQGGIGTRALLDAGVVTDLALVPEPSNMNVRTRHSGTFTSLIVVRGQSGWIGSMHRFPTLNAVDKMADVLVALRELNFTYAPDADLPGLPRYVIGPIVGGLGDELLLWRTSRIPDTCMVVLQVRILPDMTFNGVVADIERLLDRARAADPELRVELQPPPAANRPPFHGQRYAMPPLDLPVDHPLTQLVVRTYREVVGSDPARVGSEDPGSYAGTDPGHLTEAGTRALVFGPVGNLWGESYVELDKLFAHTRIFASCAAEIGTSERAQWL